MKRALLFLLTVLCSWACTHSTPIDDGKRIGAFCDATMQKAKDSHDSLSVMLACVQLIEIARVGHSAEDAKNISAAAMALSAAGVNR